MCKTEHVLAVCGIEEKGRTRTAAEKGEWTDGCGSRHLPPEGMEMEAGGGNPAY